MAGPIGLNFLWSLMGPSTSSIYIYITKIGCTGKRTPISAFKSIKFGFRCIILNIGGDLSFEEYLKNFFNFHI